MKPTSPYRSETRRQRYDRKALTAKTLPVSICCVNFGCDENLAMAIRSAVCYGAESIMIIGSVPPDTFLRPRSGTTLDYIKIVQFSTPHDFLEYCRDNNYSVVSAELCDDSVDLNDFQFDFGRKTVIVMGNENTGVPAEVLYNSQPVEVRLPGSCFCLNVTMTATVFLDHFNRQYANHNRIQYDR